MRPTNEKSIAIEATKIYLIAASMFSRADRIAMSIAEIMVVSLGKDPEEGEVVGDRMQGRMTRGAVLHAA